MTSSELVITVDISPATAWLCRYDGSALRVACEPVGPIAEAWPRWMKRLEVVGSHEVICRINAESQIDPVELTPQAHSAGATSVRLILDEPECDPAMAIVRQLGHRLREREICFAEIRAGRWCCGILDPAGRTVARSDGRVEPNESVELQIGERLGEHLKGLSPSPAGGDRPPPLLVAYGESDSPAATRVAEACGLNRVLLPHHVAALPAIGMLIADIILDYRSEMVPGPIDIPALRRAFAELMDQANDEVTRLGYDVDNTICTRRAELARIGDSTSIEVTCESIPDAGALVALFNSARANARLRGVPNASVELRAIHIRVVINTPKDDVLLELICSSDESDSLGQPLPAADAGWRRRILPEGMMLER